MKFGHMGGEAVAFLRFSGSESTQLCGFGKVNRREEGRHGRAMPWGFARVAVMKVLSDLDLYYLVVLINSNEIDIEITTPRDTCERVSWRARTGVACLYNRVNTPRQIWHPDPHVPSPAWSLPRRRMG